MITFVGRPLDSAKGLINLLAAMSLVEALPESPPFQLWIIGGDEQDVACIHEAVGCHRPLQKLLKQGQLKCWGKIAYDALPELYSRSTVLVMPSNFETFGRVAVEAMSCGCPVIAANSSGLKETVLHGLTGLLYETWDVTGLAAILADCITTPQRLNAWSSLSHQWSRYAFSLQQQFHAYFQLYQGKERVRPADIDRYTPLERYQLAIEEEFTDCFAALLNRRVTVTQWYPHPHHLVADISDRDKSYLALQYQQLDETMPILSPISETANTTRTAQQRLDKIERLLPYLLTAEKICIDRQYGCILFTLNTQQVEKLEETSFFAKATDALMSQQSVNAFNQALDQFLEAPGRASLDACDRTGSQLEMQLEGGVQLFRMRHPQVEMYRIRCYINARKSLLDANFISLSQWLLDIAAHTPPLMDCPMRLQRHDGVGRHHTGALHLTMVLDGCGVSAGPLNWACNVVWHTVQGTKLENLVSAPSVHEGQEGILGYLWLVVLLIHHGLVEAAEGNMVQHRKTNDALEQLVRLFTTKQLRLY
ncbi:MAG: glycosyltransferase family 4 protein [Magnetococcales bacterium]|nr:glycosyltransferase family 4 protein [Magnetococcales bacterium]